MSGQGGEGYDSRRVNAGGGGAAVRAAVLLGGARRSAVRPSAALRLWWLSAGGDPRSPLRVQSGPVLKRSALPG